MFTYIFPHCTCISNKFSPMLRQRICRCHICFVVECIYFVSLRWFVPHSPCSSSTPHVPPTPFPASLLIRAPTHTQFALIASLLASRSATAGHSMVASSIDRLAREFAALSTENAHLVCVCFCEFFLCTHSMFVSGLSMNNHVKNICTR